MFLIKRWLGKLTLICLSVIFSLAYTKKEISFTLPSPKENQSAVSIEQFMRGFILLKNNLLILPLHKNIVVHLPFDETGKTRKQKFGELIDSRRVTFSEVKSIPAWAYAFQIDKKIFIMDSHDLSLTIIDAENYNFLTKYSIAWDMVLPHRDKGGEAPKGEITKLRADFKKSFLSTKDEHISGIDKLANKFVGSTDDTKRFYLLTLKTKGFPFVIMECAGNPIVQCQISRVCPVSKTIQDEAMHWQGLSFIADSRIFLVGHKTNNVLRSFRFDSCAQIRSLEKDIKLPVKIKEVVDIKIDQKFRLWLGTALPDDYFNASIFYWEKDDWISFMPGTK